jgi:hypothetical protein
MKMKACIAALCLLFIGSSFAYSNYVEVFFEGTIDTVDAGAKAIGETIKGSFKYELDATGEYPSPSMTYPLQTNFAAFPLSMIIDGNSLSYHYGTSIHLVDWSEENREDFTVSTDGYLPDGNTNIRMECRFEGPDLFDSLLSLPNPPKFTNLSLARFSFSILTHGDLNTYQEKFSGVIDTISAVAHPEGPEVKLVDVTEYEIIVHYYGALQHSTDLSGWTDSPTFWDSNSLHAYTFLEGPPDRFFVRATE